MRGVNKLKINLSLIQQKIVDHTDGALLVKAGPGSGKTRVLIERIKKLLLTQKRCKVLALTFSNLAAEEMRKRIQEDSQIVDFVDNATIGTIHSFCLDVVQTRGNLIGLKSDLMIFESISDRQASLRDVLLSDNELSDLLNQQNQPDTYINKMLSLISEQKRRFITPEMCNMDELFSKIYGAYNQYLLDQNAIEFDDILYYAYRIFTENPSVVRLYTSLYKYICVDEAQDLNFAQYEVIKALCGNEYKNVMFVGDEKQSIYGFNGSDSDIMTVSFVEDFSPQVYILSENFRSAKSIVAYANRLKQSTSVSNYYYEGELKAFSFENEKDEASYIIKCINRLMLEGHKDIEDELLYNDFAIIARNKYVFTEIEKQLNGQSIPFYYKKTISGIEFESEYMKAFDFSLRLLVNPRDIIHLRELAKVTGCELKQKIENMTGLEILSFLLKDSSYSDLISAITILDLENFNLSHCLLVLHDNVDKKIYIEDNEKFMIINDINLLARHWSKYVGQVQKENRTLVSFRNNVSLGKTQDISVENGVALLTAHMSKGLQYEVVFVIGLTEGTFPDYRAINSGGKEIEQEKNNMYVAVTRAKRLCYLTYPRMKMMPWKEMKSQRKSQFLYEVNEEIIT